ncbi:MAG: peptidase [Gammaproteobacteria bacterium]|nr:MAG: peptidase [Gammaproteobacteria bacterium]
MIKNFQHKGLEKFYLKGNVSKIQPMHERRLRMILSRLESIHKPEDMNLPGFNFHALRNDMKDYYSVSVNKNWRVIFKFDGVDAFDVDYIDYH